MQFQGEKLQHHERPQYHQKCRLKCSSCLLHLSVCNHAYVLLSVMEKERDKQNLSTASTAL